jgi:hypothetical protein
MLCLIEQINLSYFITKPDSYDQKKCSLFSLLHFHLINKLPLHSQLHVLAQEGHRQVYINL